MRVRSVLLAAAFTTRVGKALTRIQPSRLIATTAIALVACLTLASVAMANEDGYYQLKNGTCCSGESLDGTRASVEVDELDPGTADCVVTASVVTSDDSNRQLQAGIGKCSSGENTDCAYVSYAFKYVERIPATGSAVCYEHGAATLGCCTELTVDDGAGNGTWYAYIAGSLYEGQSGYDSDLAVEEDGEVSPDNSCSGWAISTIDNNWQRYNYSPHNAWYTVQSANPMQGSCFLLGTINNGTFTING